SVILADMFKPGFPASRSAAAQVPGRRRSLLAAGLAGLVLSGSGLKAEPRAGHTVQPGPDARGRELETDATPELPALVLKARYVLLGEVHDNPDVHRLRLRWLRQLTATRSFAIAMEQFDLPMQPQLDAARER